MSKTFKPFLYFFYFWNERLTPLGHVLAVFLFFSLFLIWVPGIFAVKIFLFFLSSLLIVSLLTLLPKKNIRLENIQIKNVTEGDIAKVSARISTKQKILAIQLGIFRMHPALKYKGNAFYESLNPEESKIFHADIKTSRRGCFDLPLVSAVIPNVSGIATILFSAKDSFRLFVFPRVIKIKEMSFLKTGQSGKAFMPYLTPSLERGLDFIGIREYREGDSLRDLHHNAFAKYGKPFTKEFAKERGSGLILTMDISCRNTLDKTRAENTVRLTAGIASYLLERELLGRFFVQGKEVPIQSLPPKKAFEKILQALAMAPYPELRLPYPKPESFTLETYPDVPVLSVSLLPQQSNLITKQIIVSEKSLKTDEALYIVLENETEVSL